MPGGMPLGEMPLPPRSPPLGGVAPSGPAGSGAWSSPAFSDPLPPGPPPRDAALVARTPMDNSDAAGPPVEPTSGVLRSGLKTFFSSPTVQLAGNVVAALLGFACAYGLLHLLRPRWFPLPW